MSDHPVVHCPYCGSSEHIMGAPEWFAHSMDPQDVMNTAMLDEIQCMACARSFWIAAPDPPKTVKPVVKAVEAPTPEKIRWCIGAVDNPTPHQLDYLEESAHTLGHEADCARRGHGAAECTCIRAELLTYLASHGREV